MLLQRFYSCIELGDAPFIPGQGPASFGDLDTADSVVIKNGVIGLSSHHGIHGNAATDIRLENLVFRNFEVAAIALNGCHDVVMKNIDIKQNRQDINVLGIWSAGRFILPYLEHLKENHPELCLTVQGCAKSVEEVYHDLMVAQANVYEDIIIQKRKFISYKEHENEYELFHNWAGMMDGNVYGVLFNGLGVAVGGFPTLDGVSEEENLSSNIMMDDVHISNLRACHLETVALKKILPPVETDGDGETVVDESSGGGYKKTTTPPQIDPVGSVF